MTISTTASSIVVLGNGATTLFSFPFIGVAASDITVLYTDTTGATVTLSPSSYTLTLNPAGVGQLWGVGGTVLYPLAGSPIASGTSLTISRTLPLTQTTSMSNQGNFYPQVTETALDTLCMEIQQVSARTGQLRGYWSTGQVYNFGDIIQDGVNGNNTLNFYMCTIANTSGVWATDLAAGDWSIAFNVQQLNGLIGAYLPLAGGTIIGNLGVNGTTNLTGNLTAVNGAFSGNLTAVTQSSSDSSTKVATTAMVQSAISGRGVSQDFRLSLTSGTAVTTADVTGATTIYCIPYIGNSISLYDGSSWHIRTSAQFSIALGTLTNNQGYDVFCYDNSGVPTLELQAWTNNTSRATALAYQDGVLVKSGAATRRYLGSFLTTSATTTEDSIANRYLWNYYHRVPRLMQRIEPTASWTYTTAVYRQANGSTANQLNFFIGVIEDTVSAQLNQRVTNTGAVVVQTGIGFNSTTTPALSTFQSISVPAGGYAVATPSCILYPTLGKNYLAWLEYSQALGTTTWDGQSTFGLQGEVFA